MTDYEVEPSFQAFGILSITLKIDMGCEYSSLRSFEMISCRIRATSL